MFFVHSKKQSIMKTYVKTVLTSFALLIPLLSFTQASIQKDLISTAAAQHTNGAANVAWSLGEIAVDRFENASQQLVNEGFLFPLPGFITTVVSFESIGIHLYPNPVSASINLNLDQRLDGAELRIFDHQGKFVSKESITDTQTIDVKHLPSGKYFLSIHHNGRNAFKTVIKI